jgi:ATP-dependent DNA ligase
MACHTLNEKTEKKFKFPAIAQLKYDAARVAIFVSGETVSYRTRNGKTYILNNPELDQILITAAARIGGDVVFDGEMYQRKSDGTPENRLVSNGVATKFIRGTAEPEAHEKVGIAIWDVVPISSFISGIHKEGYASRFARVSLALSGFCRVHQAESETVGSATEAREVAARYMKAGQEGAIVKDPNGIWEAKRSNSSLKVKAIRDADLIITGIEEGTGKYEGMLGAINCESVDGKVKVSVGTGFSDVQRKQFCTQAIVGRIAAIEYNELVKSKNSDTYSLFLPRFIELRDDKDVADDLTKLQESDGF